MVKRALVGAGRGRAYPCQLAKIGGPEIKNLRYLLQHAARTPGTHLHPPYDGGAGAHGTTLRGGGVGAGAES